MTTKQIIKIVSACECVCMKNRSLQHIRCSLFYRPNDRHACREKKQRENELREAIEDLFELHPGSRATTQPKTRKAK